MAIMSSSGDEGGFLSFKPIFDPLKDIISSNDEKSKPGVDQETVNHYTGTAISLVLSIIGISLGRMNVLKAKNNVAAIISEYNCITADEFHKQNKIIKNGKVAMAFGIISIILLVLSELLYLRLFGILDKAQLDGVAILFIIVSFFLSASAVLYSVLSVGVKNTFSTLGGIISGISLLMSIIILGTTIHNMKLIQDHKVLPF